MKYYKLEILEDCPKGSFGIVKHMTVTDEINECYLFIEMNEIYLSEDFSNILRNIYNHITHSSYITRRPINFNILKDAKICKQILMELSNRNIGINFVEKKY